MTFSNTLGYNAEIKATFMHNDGRRGDFRYMLEVQKVGVDMWLLVTWDQRGEEKINKNAMTLYGDQLRSMMEYKCLFTRG